LPRLRTNSAVPRGCKPEDREASGMVPEIFEIGIGDLRQEVFRAGITRVIC